MLKLLIIEKTEYIYTHINFLYKFHEFVITETYGTTVQYTYQRVADWPCGAVVRPLLVVIIWIFFYIFFYEGLYINLSWEVI